MSNRPASLMQSKRVMAIVLVLFGLVAAYRLKDLLPERLPAASADLPDAELQSPGDIEQVHRQAFAYADQAAAGIVDSGRDGGLRLIPESRKDPFRLLAPAQPAASAKPAADIAKEEIPAEDPLVCSTIHMWGVRSQAIISGHTVSVGDTIRGYKVKHIDEQGVLLNGETVILFLPLRREPQNLSGAWITFDTKDNRPKR